MTPIARLAAALTALLLVALAFPAHGGTVTVERIYLPSLTEPLGEADRVLAQGKHPLLSFKTWPYSWRQVADGQADTQLRWLAYRLDALPGPVSVVLRKKPASAGTAADYAAATARAYPILGAGDNVSVGQP